MQKIFIIFDKQYSFGKETIFWSVKLICFIDLDFYGVYFFLVHLLSQTHKWEIAIIVKAE